METVNSELVPVAKELSDFRSALLTRYQEIEGKAVKATKEGNIVGNPLAENKAEETRYALSLIGLIRATARAFLEELKETNDSIPEGLETNILELDLILTTSPNYPWVDKHVFISPAISLSGQQKLDTVRFIKPQQRLTK